MYPLHRLRVVFIINWLLIFIIFLRNNIFFLLLLLIIKLILFKANFLTLSSRAIISTSTKSSDIWDLFFGVTFLFEFSRPIILNILTPHDRASVIIQIAIIFIIPSATIIIQPSFFKNLRRIFLSTPAFA